MNNTFATQTCPHYDIAAYVDSELSAAAVADLEAHLLTCAVCADTVRVQRQLLAHLSSLESDRSIELPKDFTKKVIHKAETSVVGLRHPKEILSAAIISAALFIFAIFALGGETWSVASAASAFGEKLLTVGSFAVGIFANLAFATAVIARTVAANAVTERLVLPAAILVVVPFGFLSSRWILRRISA